MGLKKNTLSSPVNTIRHALPGIGRLAIGRSVGCSFSFSGGCSFSLLSSSIPLFGCSVAFVSVVTRVVSDVVGVEAVGGGMAGGGALNTEGAGGAKGMFVVVRETEESGMMGGGKGTTVCMSAGFSHVDC